MSLRYEYLDADLNIWRQVDYDSVQNVAVHDQYNGRWRVVWEGEYSPDSLLILLENGGSLTINRNDAESSVYYPNLPSSFAGIIRMRLSDGKILSPALRVFPGSISIDDFKEIVLRLRNLAVKNGSAYREIIADNLGTNIIPLGQHLREAEPIDSLFAATNLLIDTCKSFLYVWPQIAQSLNSNIKLSYHLQTCDSPFSVLDEQSLGYNLDIGLGIEKSSDTINNSFVKYLVAHYIPKMIEDYINGLKIYKTDLIIAVKTPLSGKSLKEKSLNDRRIKPINKRILEIQTYEINLSQLQEKFILVNHHDSIKSSSDIMRFTSEMLNEICLSPIYSPLVEIYEKLKSLGHIWGLKGDLDERIDERGLEPVQKLYELWVFLEVYYSMLEFGFTSIDSRPDLTQKNIKNENNISNLPFRFEWIPLEILDSESKENIEDNARIKCIKAQLFYDKSYNGSKPDIRILLQIYYVNGTLRTENVFIDAKYRNYKNMNDKYKNQNNVNSVVRTSEYSGLVYKYGSILPGDIFETAREKYLRPNNGLASFIFHSDMMIPNYWGEVPYSAANVPKEHAYHDAEIVGHRYGALCLLPQNDMQKTLHTFWWMIFAYHLDITQYCLPCKSRAIQEKIAPKQEGNSSRGTYYNCAKCNDWWSTNICKNGHTLLKHVERGIHHRITTEVGLFYQCPRCKT